MSRPEGQAPGDAPEAYWFKCDMDAWALVRDLLPRPWPVALCMQDLRYLEARERYRRSARDGQTALQVRWGVSASTVKRYLAAARAKAGPALDQPWTKAEPSEPHQHAIADDERTSPGPALDQPWTKAEPVASENPQQVLIVEAPKRETETKTETKKTRAKVKPAGLAPEELAAIVAEMHAVIAPHYPKARPPAPSSHRKEIEFALRCLAELSMDTGRPARDLLLIGWRYMVEGSRYWRDKLALASEFYSIACTEDKCVKNARAGLEREAAAAPVAPAEAPTKPKSPGEVAWDRWMEGLDAARAWYSAHKGTREGDAFHAAMEAACKPNPIAELFGGYMDNPKEKRLVREVFIAEYERRTTPLRLVAR